MPRKPVGFRLEAELVARMEDAVASGVATNKTELVEWALEKALGENVAPVAGVLKEPLPARDAAVMRGVEPVRSWRQHAVTCSCAVCKPPKGTG